MGVVCVALTRLAALPLSSQYDQLIKFKEKHGHCVVTRKQDNSLGIWVQKQRKFFRERQAGKTSNILSSDKVVSSFLYSDYGCNIFMAVVLYSDYGYKIFITLTFAPIIHVPFAQCIHVGSAQQYWLCVGRFSGDKIGKICHKRSVKTTEG